MRFLLLLLFTGFCRPLCAQYNWQYYTPLNGLVDTRLEKIYQDSRGILYFLTRDGFSTYDGQRFRNYTQYNNNPLSIVSDILEEPDGSLLIVSITGIYFLRQHTLYKDTVRYSKSVEPGAILVTPTGERIIAANSGLALYKGGSAQLLTAADLQARPQPLVTEKVICRGDWLVLIQAVPGGKGADLVLYNWRQQRIVSRLQSLAAVNLRQYGQSLYVLTRQGCFELDAAALSSGRLLLRPPAFAALLPRGRQVNDLLIDRRGDCWLITNDQLYNVDTGRGIVTLLTAADGFPAGVTQIFEDRENNYWLAVADKGLQKMTRSRIAAFRPPGRSASLKVYPYLSTSPEGVVNMYWKDTLALLQRSGFAAAPFAAMPGVLQAFYWNGQRWRLFASGSLQSEKGKKLQLVDVPPGLVTLSDKIAFDSEGRLLVAGNRLLVVSRNLDTATASLPGFADNVVCSAPGTYWCFTRNGYIQNWRMNGNRLVLQQQYRDNTGSPRFALHWNADTFCIGTRSNGILFARAGQQSYKICAAVNTDQGLSNNFVACLLRMGGSKLLAAGVTGLDLLHIHNADTAVEQVFSRAGLFSGVSFVQALNDSVALALSGTALYTVQTSTARQPAASPQLFFSQLTVDGKDVQPGNLPAFRYNENNFRFRVSAPSFVDEKNIRFVFELSGAGKAAVQNGRQAEAEYTNLEPGSYSLTVTAFFPGDVPLSKTIRTSFTIRRPFWNTPFFVTGVVVVLLLLAYTLFRSLLRRKLLHQRIELEKQQAVAKERTRIATDMHDDLGAGISTIKYLSQPAPFVSPEMQQANNLKIAAQADALVDKMNDIIWAMNESNDTLDNLVYYCKAWAVEYCDAHQLPVNVQVPDVLEAVTVRGDVRQHIFLCIKEAVHNAVKHAGATALLLQFSVQPGRMEIVVSDNGRGFDPEKIKPGNGLHNMQKRMLQLRGTFTTGSNSPGTVLRFSVPL